MDMSSNSSSMSMPMYFSNSLPIIVVFQGWNISDVATLVGSCFVVAGLGIIYEIIKRLRQFFMNVYFKKSPYGPQTRVSPGNTDISAKHNYRYFWCMHLLNSLTFIIQVFMSYLLMLIVMTYNTWLFVSVVLGLTVGYFIGYFVAAALGIDDNPETFQDTGESPVRNASMTITNNMALTKETTAGKMQLPVINLSSESSF